MSSPGGSRRSPGAAAKSLTTAVRSLSRAIRAWYGARPLHLLTLLAAFALAGYALRAVVLAHQWRGFAVWFIVAIIGHDLLLFPLYSLADLSAAPAAARLGRQGRRGPSRRGGLRPAAGAGHQLHPGARRVRAAALAGLVPADPRTVRGFLSTGQRAGH